VIRTCVGGGQLGKVKVNGETTTLHKFNVRGKQLTGVKKVMNEYEKSDFGLHILAAKITKMLKKAVPISHTTAARMMQELGYS
jgi:hypothetical protein